MSYRIAVKRSAAKALKKIPKPDRKRIVEKIDSLAENLPNPDTTKMKGNNPFHKVRTGDYRIIYEVQVRIPPHCDHSFRYKLTTDSAAL